MSNAPHHEPGPTAPVQLFRLLVVLGLRLRALMDQQLAPLGITTQQAAILTILESVPESPTLGRLAQALGTTQQNVRQLVDVLERKGLVVVSTDEQDRRARRITATPRVRELFGPRDAVDHAAVEGWFAELSEAEALVAVGLLSRVAGSLPDVAPRRPLNSATPRSAD